MDIVSNATNAFRSADYLTAKELYQQAASRYGQHLFAANITLCEHALQYGRKDNSQLYVIDNNIDKQLTDTQCLLEHYFSRCQELEYQLLDR